MALVEQSNSLSPAALQSNSLQGTLETNEEPYSTPQSARDMSDLQTTEVPPTFIDTPAAGDSYSSDDSGATQIDQSSNDKGESKILVSNDVASEHQSKARRIKFEDFIDLNDLVFEWADSYDNKDWERLSKILAPTMIVDYSIVGHDRIDDLPAAEFISMMSSAAFLGDQLVKTQHLMGARKFEVVSDTEIIGHHQIRAAHQRYCSDGKTVERRGHGHSFIKHWYLKVEGEWKLKGLCPKIYWNEKDFDKIFVQLKGQR